ncbi:MAG: hypothetical protein U1E02_11590 [Hydrogenophaga sp.]|nr:hypothetical protein [Hydrogenophaga sp.]
MIGTTSATSPIGRQFSQGLVFAQLRRMGKRPGLEHALHVLHGLPEGVAVFRVMAVVGGPVRALKQRGFGQHSHAGIDERSAAQSVADQHSHVRVGTKIEQPVRLARPM